MRSKFIATTLFTCSLFSLTGCTAALKTMDIGFLGSEDAPVAEESISVDQLLSRARGEKGYADNHVPRELVLHFADDTVALDENQKDNLNEYANAQPSKLSIECSPSESSDRFVAVGVGINRCNAVSNFLEKRAKKTDMRLSPSLAPNQVLIKKTNNLTVANHDS
ncbi:hypothetical protein ACMXYO_04330 [Neptuniibacter sp. QD37_6]|uniref:hypothetical protein n=1 Tax=Neptuniibacter sp. QD37_6 TaxID=3398210 RepID=UPI0039F4611C